MKKFKVVYTNDTYEIVEGEKVYSGGNNYFISNLEETDVKTFNRQDVVCISPIKED